MTPNTQRTSLQPEPVLRWIFRRNAKEITCELDVRPNRSYEVCIVPHWDPASSVIERFERPTAALLRHAEIARRLRDDGWVVTDHVSAGRAPVAA